MWRAGTRACFLFRWRNGLNAQLFIAHSGDASNSELKISLMPGRSLDWGWRAHSARAPAVRQASCPAIPAAAMARRVHASAAAPLGWDYPADIRAAARLACPVSPAVFRAVRLASTITEPTPRCSRRNLGGTFHPGAPVTPVRQSPRCTSHPGVWQTASMLWPSGSSTNAP